MGALDGEEFFAIEGSPCQLPQDFVDIDISSLQPSQKQQQQTNNNKPTNQETNKPTNQQTNKQTNKQTNNQPTNQPTNKQRTANSKQQTNEQTNKRTNEQTNKRTNEQTNEQTNKQQYDLERRKLWPIACAERLLKFAETLVIEEEIKDVLKKLESRQLGCGTPDAAPLLVRLMRSWAEDIHTSTLQSRNATSSERHHTPQEQETADMDDVEEAQAMQDREEEVQRRTRQAELDPKPAIQGILCIDLETADGRMLRSAALKGPKFRAPRTAAMAATLRRAAANRIWCREGTTWRTIWTERDGWQGARSAQLLFAMSLEDAADNTKVMTSSRITRVGFHDDMHAVADPEDLTSLLEELKIELQACGHRLRMHTRKVWLPGWDDR